MSFAALTTDKSLHASSSCCCSMLASPVSSAARSSDRRWLMCSQIAGMDSLQHTTKSNPHSLENRRMGVRTCVSARPPAQSSIPSSSLSCARKHTTNEVKPVLNQREASRCSCRDNNTTCVEHSTHTAPITLDCEQREVERERERSRDRESER